jgi:hypothetical protein
MANFKTHLAVATAISGAASISLLSLHLSKPLETGGYFLLGVLGGLLPDIDSDKSTPLTLIFYFLSMYCAFALVFNLTTQYSFAELLAIWAIIYFVIRYLVFKMVIRITVHRGTFHSLLAVVFVTLLTANISYYFLHKLPSTAWNSGIFMGIGYLVHLCLDEVYSVDLHNKRMRKSFGTALKPISQENLGSSLLMLAIVCVFIQYAPPVKNYWQQFNHALAKHDLQKKWLPAHNRWFENLLSYDVEMSKT